MVEANKNTYALDECSLIHLCELEIPPAFTRYFDKNKLVHKNCSKLKTLINKLDYIRIDKYRFKPLNIDYNIIKFADELLAEQGNQLILLGRVLKTQITNQLKDFCEDFLNNFKEILKSEDIESIKKLFIDNDFISLY